MNSSKIRDTFFEFFENKGHEIIPSAPIVMKNDPTLMFTNAGMNQFKDVFLGNTKPINKRVADTQKCLRVSGKHNDLEEVGVDTYHHTMFEMLGNWSFGDYFKKEAISWSWELFTKVYGLDKDRLYVTIFEGDERDQTPEDKEAYDNWKQLIPEERILRFGKKDNFWEMGASGPCGPSSEIHFDIRSEEERKSKPGKELVNMDHPEVIELWNLVFIEYNRLESGKLEELPDKHVDTGMGFERLAMVLQGKKSSYDSDVFRPLIQQVEKKTAYEYNSGNGDKDIAIRVMVDHIRAIAFSIADGQLPSNTGAGYVIRRILRRAVRYGYSFLQLKEPFLNELAGTLTKQMEGVFPELNKQGNIIQKVIREEEVAFLRTLSKGISRFNEYAATLKKGEKIDGKFAFELYDTYGFPIDLTQLMARENNLQVNMPNFHEELKKQKERSRAATQSSAGDWTVLHKDDKEEFIGYDYTQADVKITRYRKVKTKKKELFHLVFSLTPFYPEGGGQIGDTGYIDDGKNKISVIDTRKENNVIIHITEKLPAEPGKTFKAVVSESKRRNTARNHSATHLLHHALRNVLGEHVEQKGSLVNPDYLRFDFSHFEKVSPEELRDIEEKVNSYILQNISLEEKRSIPFKEAEEMGALALFGEKYGDVVRVIKFGDSIELCGGTHVKATGDIGLFKFTNETAVASGVRRVEAITGPAAHKRINKQEQLLEKLQQLLKNPKDTYSAVEKLTLENQNLQKELDSFQREKAGIEKEKLINSKVERDGVNFIASRITLDDPGLIKELAFQLRKEVPEVFAVLAAEVKGKPNLTVAIADSVVESKELNAGNIIRELAKEIKGGGGGQPFFATAGGSDISGLDKAVSRAGEFL